MNENPKEQATEIVNGIIGRQAIALQLSVTVTSTNTVQSEEPQLMLFHVSTYIQMVFDQSQS